MVLSVLECPLGWASDGVTAETVRMAIELEWATR